MDRASVILCFQVIITYTCMLHTQPETNTAIKFEEKRIKYLKKKLTGFLDIRGEEQFT